MFRGLLLGDLLIDEQYLELAVQLHDVCLHLAGGSRPGLARIPCRIQEAASDWHSSKPFPALPLEVQTP